MPTATKGGKKVRTRLNNGLYGWRKRKVGLRRIESNLKGTDGELESSSENIQNIQTKRLLPAGSSIKTGKVSVYMSGKFNFDGWANIPRGESESWNMETDPDQADDRISVAMKCRR